MSQTTDIIIDNQIETMRIYTSILKKCQIHMCMHSKLPQPMTADLKFTISSSFTGRMPVQYLSKDTNYLFQITIGMYFICVCQILGVLRPINYNMKHKNLTKAAPKPSHQVAWSKLIWNTYVSPAKPFITWSLMHYHMTIDDHLHRRGYGWYCVVDL